MPYTALYRRYRPRSFAGLVGQPHIARVLAAAVSRQSFVHAYLFCGPRGTGKTSAARILARAINCMQPLANGDPCGQCPACKREAAGESLDIIEIDGASNRGIDEIRDLRERVKYAPAQEKFKVYIIDEVHMLTNDAFNALLKTLEEPPAHVVFIFATTAPHKLPPTVLSRCQRFDFRRIGDTDIADHLLDIAGQEQIALTADGAALIARKAEGGMRDAVSLLDQCAGAFSADVFGDVAGGPSGPRQIDAAAVSELLGAVDRSFILAWLQLLLAHDTAGVLQGVEQLASSGRDLRQALADLLETSRDVLLAVLSRNKGGLADAEAEFTAPDWAASYAPSAYLSLLQALADVDARMRYSLSPRLTLELALIQACGAPASDAALAPPPAAAPLPQLKPVAPPLSPAAAPVARPRPTVSSTHPAPSAAAAPPPVPFVPSAAAAVLPTANRSSQLGAAELQRVQQQWPEILRLIGEENPGALAILRLTRPDRIENGRLCIDFPPEMAMMMRSVLRPEGYRGLVERVLSQTLDCRLPIDGFVGRPRAPEQPPKSEKDDLPAPEAPPEVTEQGNLF